MAKTTAFLSAFLIALMFSGFALVGAPPFGRAQTAPFAAPAVEWQKILPSELGISATCIIQTSDGGYAVGGDGDYKTGFPGFLVRLGSSGNMEWNQSYITDNKYADYIQALVQTKDGGYALLVGGSELIKTDSEGRVQWNITLNGVDVASSMLQTSDGGYALAGYATTAQVQNGRYESDFWLAKVNSAGTLLWSKTLGKTLDTEASSIIQACDGGYALAGKSNAYSDTGEYDFMLVKTDSSGNQLWLKTFGGAGGDSEANSVIQTSDGGYILAGDTTAYGLGGYDAWLVKTDSSGNLIWTRTYGGTGILPNFYPVAGSPVAGSNGSGDDHAYSLIQTSDGGLAFIGSSEYEPGAGTGNTVVWLVKTDSVGNTQWNETFGGPFQGWAGNSLIETSDGAFAIAGYDQEPGFPWEGNYFIVKTEPALPSPPSSASPPLSPSPTASFSPAPPPVLEFPSTTINSDGSFSPASAPIQRSGNVYTFTDDLKGQLIVNRDNVVIDGDGYSLQGNGSAGNLYIRQSQTGLNLTGQTNVTITNLQIYNYNNGVYVDNSLDANLSGNNIMLNGYGIFEAASSFVDIFDNNITQNNYDIFVNALSENNKIVDNNIESAMSFGITLNESSGNVIFSNNLTSSGIDDESGSNNLIAGNLMYSDYYGVYLNGATDSIIAANNFTACSFGADSPAGASGNLFYMNDFNNTHANEFKGNQKNSWDNGTVGNYWSDYQTMYPNATEIDNSGIGDTEYTVSYGYIPASLGPAPNSNTPNPNDVDHYPLLFPVSSASAEALAQTLVLAHAWSPTPTQSPSPPQNVTSSPSIPEFPSWIILPLLAMAALFAEVFFRKKQKEH